MSDTLSREAAEATVRSALRGFATAAELTALPCDTPLRTALGLDSLDFLTFVERLTVATGIRIDEIDYPNLVTIGMCVEFLTTRARVLVAGQRCGSACSHSATSMGSIVLVGNATSLQSDDELHELIWRTWDSGRASGTVVCHGNGTDQRSTVPPLGLPVAVQMPSVAPGPGVEVGQSASSCRLGRNTVAVVGDFDGDLVAHPQLDREHWHVRGAPCC